MHRALGIGVLVIAASFGVLFAAAPPARAANVYLHLYGTTAGGWSFTSGTETNPGPTITTDSTDVVTLNLTSDDGQPHIFLLDYNGNNNSQPWEPTSSTFSVTDTTLVFSSAPPGTYFYICDIHDWAMRGVWIVQGPPVPDTAPPVIASATVNPPSPLVSDTVTISASVTDNVGVANVSAHIVGPSSFDQNLTMTGPEPTFTVSRVFTAAGTYTVTIWANDSAGNNASQVDTFTVSASSNPPGGNPPADNTGIWAAVAAVVILLFLLFALAMWRRGAKKAEPPRKPESPET